MDINFPGKDQNSHNGEDLCPQVSSFKEYDQYVNFPNETANIIESANSVS